jgi:hypothetical protein
VEIRSGKKGTGVGADAYSFGKGTFLTMKHLLATMVSVPTSPGRMPSRGIRTMEHLLAMMVSLPASPLSGRLRLSFFI